MEGNHSGKKKKITGYVLVIVGVMAAICYVVTVTMKIPVPTTVGQTMIKLANAFCLLAGALFGGWRGGLAAGIGSMLYDLFDPVYITSAPITLVRFFLMAFLCGVICFARGQKGKNFWQNSIGITVGSVFSTLFYIVESVIKQMILGQPFGLAVAACSTKMVTSSINMVIAIVIAIILTPLCRAGLEKAGIYRKL